jgi:hypothetical protein
MVVVPCLPFKLQSFFSSQCGHRRFITAHNRCQVFGLWGKFIFVFYNDIVGGDGIVVVWDIVGIVGIIGTFEFVKFVGIVEKSCDIIGMPNILMMLNFV